MSGNNAKQLSANCGDLKKKVFHLFKKMTHKSKKVKFSTLDEMIF